MSNSRGPAGSHSGSNSSDAGARRYKGELTFSFAQNLFSFLEIQEVPFLAADSFHFVQQGLVLVGLRLRLERLAH